MSVYESIMAGLTEAVEDAKSNERKLQRNTLFDPPSRDNQADDKRMEGLLLPSDSRNPRLTKRADYV